jgi:hypothetical protein
MAGQAHGPGGADDPENPADPGGPATRGRPDEPGGPAAHGRPDEPGDLEEQLEDLSSDPVRWLVSAVNTLPQAQRDAVYAWLLRREAAVPAPGGPRLPSLELENVLMRPGSPALAQSVRTAFTGGQQMVPVRFPAEQHAQLREWCGEHGFSMATVIRGLVARFLEGQRA